MLGMLGGGKLGAWAGRDGQLGGHMDGHMGEHMGQLISRGLCRDRDRSALSRRAWRLPGRVVAASPAVLAVLVVRWRCWRLLCRVFADAHARTHVVARSGRRHWTARQCRRQLRCRRGGGEQAPGRDWPPPRYRPFVVAPTTSTQRPEVVADRRSPRAAVGRWRHWAWRGPLLAAAARAGSTGTAGRPAAAATWCPADARIRGRYRRRHGAAPRPRSREGHWLSTSSTGDQPGRCKSPRGRMPAAQAMRGPSGLYGHPWLSGRSSRRINVGGNTQAQLADPPGRVPPAVSRAAAGYAARQFIGRDSAVHSAARRRSAEDAARAAAGRHRPWSCRSRTRSWGRDRRIRCNSRTARCFIRAGGTGHGDPQRARGAALVGERRGWWTRVRSGRGADGDGRVAWPCAHRVLDRAVPP